MKNIILFSDGTGNGAAKRHGTNVWKLYRALDIHRDDQVTFYDDGVGSQEFLPLKLLGGAFGFGLKRNVKELYKFLCTNYEKDDKIYLFGFSRGAFTVRMLVGMVDYCGLYTGFSDEADLDEKVENNYYRMRTEFKQTPLSRIFCGSKEIREVKEGTLFPDIEFVGVWDTVDAYGFPIDELAEWWDRTIFPIRFPDQKLSVRVKKACHALSVDDERHTFHPVLWDEGIELERVKEGKVAENRIEQVWFSGAHSDVGGGYPRDSLSLVTLDWMISKVEAAAPDAPGLHFIAQKREEIDKHSDWHGMQHDPRSGFGAYYRYKPRGIHELCNDVKNGVSVETPKIHRSVFERIQNRGAMYAPVGLPEAYEVVVTRGSGSKPVYETDDQKKERASGLKKVEAIVHQRTNLYYAFVIVSLVLAASRLFLEWEDRGSILFIPDFARGWVYALLQNPAWMVGFIAVFGVLFLRKYSLSAQTKKKVVDAWAALKNRA